MAGRHTRFDARWLSARLPEPGPSGRYIIALSGGADSCALAAAVAEVAAGRHVSAVAVHVNHGVHADADRWQEHCRALCERLGLAFEAHRVNPDPDSPLGPEAEWRRCRYGVFETVLAPGDILLTAHHRQDQAETVLMHLARGSGPDGLSGIPRERPLGAGRICRPLLEVEPESLKAYCSERGIDWISDPSNLDPALDRGYLRSAVLPSLRERWPGIDATLGDVARLQAEAVEVLHHVAGADLQSLAHDGHVLALGPVLRQPAAVLPLVIREWVRGRALPPIPRSRLQAFCEQLNDARDDSHATLAWAGHALRRYRDALWLTGRDIPQPTGTMRWPTADCLDLGAGVGTLSAGTRVKDDEWTPLEVRFRRGGERFDPGAGRPRRPVKDLLREAGIPPWYRDLVPLVSDADGIVALGDLQLSERFQHRLERLGGRLRWAPADPLLAAVRNRLNPPRRWGSVPAPSRGSDHA